MSFYQDGILYRSTVLDGSAAVHGFSTRAGGVSTVPVAATMNLAVRDGDTPENVLRNTEIFARALSRGAYGAADAVCAPQIHSARIRRVFPEDCGEGVVRAPGESGDGFITDAPGVLLLVRMADCVPILFFARREDGSPLAAAVHAGWRGTVAGIAPEAVRQLVRMGASLPTVRAALGQAIHACCYEVGDDFYDAVRESRGEAFAARHIVRRGASLYADVPGMNRALLLDAGLSETQIDVSPRCTACAPLEFHSHRAGGGRRGAMAAAIAILHSPGGTPATR